MKAAVQGNLAECLDVLQNQIIAEKMVPTIEAVRDIIQIVGRDISPEASRKVYDAVSVSFDTMKDKAMRKRAHASTLSSLMNVHLQAKQYDAGREYYKKRKLIFAITSENLTITELTYAH
jgi:hypothetical protein